MPFSAGTVDLTAQKIGESFIAKNDNIWEWPPRIECLDERSGVGQITYNLPKLANSLMAGYVADWRIGTEPPTEQTIDFDTVSFEALHAHTHVIKRPLKRPAAHRFADLERTSPIIFSIMSQGLNQEVVALLTDTTVHVQGSFTNGPLDVQTGDQTPMLDINADLAAIRPLRLLLGLSFEAVCDRETSIVFRRQFEYTGGGALGAGVSGGGVVYGGNVSAMISEDEWVQRFKAAHGIDQVKIFDSIENSAVLGVAPSIDYVGKFLWIGLVDRRKAVSRLMDMENFDTPDGAIQLVLSRKPEFVSWDTGMRTEAEFHAGRFARDVISPRYLADSTQVSVVYQSAEIHT